jgi:uncharacterized protein (UPF0335 family)
MTNAQLPAIVSNIEKLEEDRRGAGADIRAAYKEAKSKGFNVKALQRIVRERKLDVAERAEMEATMNVYRAELGPAELVKAA